MSAWLQYTLLFGTVPALAICWLCGLWLYLRRERYRKNAAFFKTLDGINKQMQDNLDEFDREPEAGR